MVDAQTELGLGPVLQGEAVLGFAAGDDIGGNLGDGVDAAGQVGGVVAAELERGAQGSAILGLPQRKVPDVDVLGRLRESGSAEDGGGGGESELHLEGWGKDFGLVKL